METWAAQAMNAVLVCEDAIVKGELDANRIIAGISAVYQPTDAEADSAALREE